MLSVINAIPDGLLELDVANLYQVLSGPTLIHLPGKLEPPLFVATLLHGNEDTGWLALQKLLTKYVGQELPRAMSILIGNVQAARYKQRHLAHQLDFNRIWHPGDRPEQIMAQQVISEMRSRRVFASIDIHNNTGLNPHYGCVNFLDNRFLYLAKLFTSTVVYFTNPKTVQSRAFGALCPSVVLECGQPGQPEGLAHALNYLETCLQLTQIPDKPVKNIDLFHTAAVVKIPADTTFSFGDSDADICFATDLDHLNFCELPANTKFGRVPHVNNRKVYLEAWDRDNRNVSDRFFKIVNDELLLTRSVMPSMLTLQSEIIRQDCLCYLMERLELKN